MATYKTGWMKKLIDGVSTKIFAISHVKAVYYDYANSKTLKSKLDEMDTSINNRLKKAETVASGEYDLNKYNTAGLYYFEGGNIANAPGSASDCYFYLEVIKFGSTVLQILIRDSIIWGRIKYTYVPTGWNDWYVLQTFFSGRTSEYGFTITSMNEAEGRYSFATGYSVKTLENQLVAGHFNNTSLATANGLYGTSKGTSFVIGNGASSSASNAFRVTGEGLTYAKGSYNSTGADYAEFSEWADGNPNDEDRRGYFVTYDEEKPSKIRKANEGDYILGIVSGNPCIIGNADEDWMGRYVFDEFGTIQYEEVEEEEEYVDEETGETKTRTVTITKYKENPDYDPTREYEQRENRKEWSAVGWLGVLQVRDDGSCIPGGYCKPINGGIATTSERGTDTYRVLERVTDNIVKVVLK